MDNWQELHTRGIELMDSHPADAIALFNSILGAKGTNSEAFSWTTYNMSALLKRRNLSNSKT